MQFQFSQEGSYDPGQLLVTHSLRPSWTVSSGLGYGRGKVRIRVRLSAITEWTRLGCTEIELE